jgi:hypothetical protein
MVAGRKQWIDYEVGVRVAGTNNSKATVRKALGKEWALKNVAAKTQCVTLLQTALLAVDAEVPLAATAAAANTVANNLHTQANRKTDSVNYFKSCRDAIVAYRAWSDAVFDVHNAWRDLRNYYRNDVPAAARTNGQTASITNANNKVTAATAQQNTVRTQLAVLTARLMTDPIYNNPVAFNANKVLAEHVPKERVWDLPGNRAPGRDGFANANQWQAAPLDMDAGGNSEHPILWFQVDPATNLVTDVCIAVLTSRMDYANSLLLTASG